MKRTALKRTKKKASDERLALANFMMRLFLQIWRERPPRCQSCSKFLGSEPRTIFFDHLLEKSKFPELVLEKWNIFLVCEECHDLKNRAFPTLKHKEAIEKAKEFFENDCKSSNFELKPKENE